MLIGIKIQEAIEVKDGFFHGFSFHNKKYDFFSSLSLCSPQEVATSSASRGGRVSPKVATLPVAPDPSVGRVGPHFLLRNWMEQGPSRDWSGTS